MRRLNWWRMSMVLGIAMLWFVILRANAAFPPEAACCAVTIPPARAAEVRVGVICLDYARRFPRTTALQGAETEGLRPDEAENLPINGCVVEPGYLRWALIYALEQGDLVVDHWPVQLASWFLSEVAQGQHTIADVNNDTAWHFDGSTTPAQRERAREIVRTGWERFQATGQPPTCSDAGNPICEAFSRGDIALDFSELVPFDPSPHGAEPFQGIGSLRLTNLLAGISQTVSIPAGISLPTGSNNQRLLAFPLGRLVVTKFRDRNGNGMRDSGETWDGPPVAIEVSVPRGRVDGKTIRGDGAVEWNDLPPGEYRVQETVPAGYCVTTPNPVPAVVRGNQTTEIAVGNRGGDLEAFKFDDRNGNGQHDTGEPPMSGVTMTLTWPNGQTEQKVTGADGTVRWGDLVGGSYTVEATLPPGAQATTPTIQRATVTPCQLVRVVFGSRMPGRLLLHKFFDANGNGREESGEGWAGPAITYQVRAPNGETRTHTALRLLDLQLTGLQTGDYTVTEVVPAGYCVSTPNPQTVRVVAGQEARLDFGNRGTSLEIFKFHDRNGNGRQDAGEPPMRGITVTVTFPDGHTETRQTGEDGTARWPQVPGGRYSATVTLLPGYSATLPLTQAIEADPCQPARLVFAARYFLTHPKGMAVDEARDRLFVAYRGPEGNTPGTHPSPALAFVDANPESPALHTITRVITTGIGTTPIGVAFNRATNIVYVGSFDEGVVTAVNGETGALMGRLDPSASAENARVIWVGVNPLRNHIYVVNYGADSVSILDGNPASPTFHTRIGELGGFSAPWGLAVDPTNDFIYIGDREFDPFQIRVLRDTGAGLTLYNTILLDGASGHPPVGAPYVMAVKPDPGAYRLYHTIAVDPARANPDRLVTLNIGRTVDGTPDPKQYELLRTSPTGPYSEGGLFYNPTSRHVYVTEGAALGEPTCDPVATGRLHTFDADGLPLGSTSFAPEAIQHGLGAYTMRNPFAVVANPGTGYIYVGDRCLDEVLVLREPNQNQPTATPTAGPTRTPTATPTPNWPLRLSQLRLPLIMRSATSLGPTPTPTATAAPPATATPSPTPTNTPGPACTQLVVNPSFESEAGWQLNAGVQYLSNEAHTGGRSVRTGITSGFSSLQQSVVIPASAGSVTLRAWYLPPTTTDGDYSYLSLRSGGTTTTLLSEAGRPTRDWREVVSDLGAFRGRTVSLFAGTYNNGAGSTTVTLYDDVTLTICP